ncbi:MAG: helix-turn-helix transcriptional regulator [bacterium]|jgi:hypothetical protein
MVETVYAGFNRVPQLGPRLHSHELWEMVFYTQGEGRILVGQKFYDFRCGTTLCLPPAIPHEEHTHIPYCNYCLSIRGIEWEPHVIEVQDSGDHPIFALARLICQEALQEAPLHQERMEHLATVLISHIEEIQKSGRPDYVQRLKEELLRNVDNPDFDLGQRMEGYPVCADHLRRCFEKAFGVNPKSFQLQLRLEQARQRLRNGQSVKEAARQSGFPDQNYFSRRFKFHFGYCPTECSPRLRSDVV